MHSSKMAAARYRFTELALQTVTAVIKCTRNDDLPASKWLGQSFPTCSRQPSVHNKTWNQSPSIRNGLCHLRRATPTNDGHLTGTKKKKNIEEADRLLSARKIWYQKLHHTNKRGFSALREKKIQCRICTLNYPETRTVIIQILKTENTER